MKNLSLALKIGSGFGVVLLFLAAVSLVSWRSLQTLADGVSEYRRIAINTNSVAGLQANMLMVRMNVKDFIIGGKEKDLQQFNEYWKTMEELLQHSRDSIRNPERAAVLDSILKDTQVYQDAFEQVVSFSGRRNQLFDQLGVLGAEVERQLTSMLETASGQGHALAAFEAGLALRRLLLCRLNVMKFLENNEPQLLDIVNEEFEELHQEIADLSLDAGNLSNGPAMMEKIQQGTADYKALFDVLAQGIFHRNEIISGSLDSIGPRVAAAVEEIKGSYKSDQDRMGPKLEAAGSTAKRTVLLAAIIAMVFGAGASVYLARSIAGPVRKTALFAEAMAGGDFTRTLEVDRKDEIGVMATSLNTMVVQLGGMVREIVGGVNSLSSASTQLAAVSDQLSSAARDTSAKSGSVSAATEEMSSNIQSVSAAMEESSGNVGMVASSTEEMTATVNEIAQNAEKARSVSEEAVRQSMVTSRKMSELGESAMKVGRVTETITEISEQTNLLALNATIEAARAGEAGKGFAVVANEIKELARQTAAATVDIKGQIGEMQASTTSTVEDIGMISGIISDINSMINAIATAVEQQSAATSEIAANITQASQGIAEVNESVAQSTVVVSDITREIADINRQSGELEGSSSQVQESATSLSGLAASLKNLVDAFKV